MSVLAHDAAPHLYARMIPGVGVDIALVEPLGDGGIRAHLTSESLVAWLHEHTPREMMLELSSLNDVSVDEITWLLSTHGSRLASVGVKHVVVIVHASLLARSGTAFREAAAAQRNVDAAFFDQQAAGVRWVAGRALNRTWPPSLQEISEVLSRGDRKTALTMLRALQGFTLSVAAPSLDTMAVPALMGIRVNPPAAPTPAPAPDAAPAAAPVVAQPPAGWITSAEPAQPTPAAAADAAPAAAQVSPPAGWIVPAAPVAVAEPAQPAPAPAPVVEPPAVQVSPPAGWITPSAPEQTAAPAPNAAAAAPAAPATVPAPPPEVVQPPAGWGVPSASPPAAPVPVAEAAPPAPVAPVANAPVGWGQAPEAPKTWGVDTSAPAASPAPATAPPPPANAAPEPVAAVSTAPVLRARSVTEAHLYMDLRGAQPGPRPNRIVFRGNDMYVIYDVKIAPDGRASTFEFLMPEQEYFGDADLGPGSSTLLGPGELIAHADTLAKSMPASPKFLSLEESRGAAYRIRLALICMREVLKFIPAGADAVPASAFVSALDREVYGREPGRFSKLRLEAVTGAYESIDRQYHSAVSPN